MFSDTELAAYVCLPLRPPARSLPIRICSAVRRLHRLRLWPKRFSGIGVCGLSAAACPQWSKHHARSADTGKACFVGSSQESATEFSRPSTRRSKQGHVLSFGSGTGSAPHVVPSTHSFASRDSLRPDPHNHVIAIGPRDARLGPGQVFGCRALVRPVKTRTAPHRLSDCISSPRSGLPRSASRGFSPSWNLSVGGMTSSPILRTSCLGWRRKRVRSIEPVLPNLWTLKSCEVPHHPGISEATRVAPARDS